MTCQLIIVTDPKADTPATQAMTVTTEEADILYSAGVIEGVYPDGKGGTDTSPFAAGGDDPEAGRAPRLAYCTVGGMTWAGLKAARQVIRRWPKHNGKPLTEGLLVSTFSMLADMTRRMDEAIQYGGSDKLKALAKDPAWQAMKTLDK